MVNPIVVVAVLLMTAMMMADGYVIKPWSLHHVGRAQPGRRLWRPSRAMSFGPELAAVRLSTSEYTCEDSGSCEYVTAYTANDGKDWKVMHQYTDYCGTSGILKDGVLRCLHSELVDDGKDDVITYKQHAFTITKGGLISGPEMTRTEVGEQATFTSPPDEEKPLKGIRRFGDQVAFFPEAGLYFRNAALILANDTEVHALYKSEDGQAWNFTSFIPIPFGQESSLMRWGETRLYIIAGKPGNYTQAESIYLGLHWEKVQPSKFTNLMNTYTSPYYTSIYTGLKGLPGLFAAAQGSKKGSEKPINIADFHNRLVKRREEGVAPQHATNFSQAFINSTNNFDNETKFSCHEEPHSTDPADGCESSSDATIVSTQNGTVFLFYDKLHAGFGPATEEQGSDVYALKLFLNETKEAKEHEEKIEADKKRKEQEKEREEARRQREKEDAERRKRERREKRRKDKERRAAYTAMDQPNLERAQKEQELDDELIVIREVDPAWVDLEKDMY